MPAISRRSRAIRVRIAGEDRTIAIEDATPGIDDGAGTDGETETEAPTNGSFAFFS